MNGAEKPVGDRTVALFWPFIKKAQKEKRLKLLTQGSDDQANSDMQQKQLQEMALKITQLERFMDDQNKTLSDVIDKVNDEASRGDRSIPGMIDTSTSSSTSKSSALSTAQALVVSLQARLTEAESRKYDPNHNRQGPGRGRGGDRNGGGPGRGGAGRTKNVLDLIDETKDQRLIAGG